MPTNKTAQMPGRGKSGNYDGHPSQCTATSKQKKERCKNAAVPGMPTCRFHGSGGKQLVGVNSPSFKHGGYSKHLPKRYGDDYQAAVDDPQLLEMRTSIALVEARIQEVLKRVDEEGSAVVFGLLQGAMRAFTTARDAADTGQMDAQLREMERLIKRGVGDQAVWREVMDLTERKRKLVESETKRAMVSKTMLSADRMDAIMGFLTTIILREIKDEDTRTRISQAIMSTLPANGAGDRDTYELVTA